MARSSRGRSYLFLDKLAKHLGLTSDGEAIKQLLELVGHAKPAPLAQPAGKDEGTLDLSRGPTGGQAATEDRPAEKTLLAYG